MNTSMTCASKLEEDFKGDSEAIEIKNSKGNENDQEVKVDKEEKEEKKKEMKSFMRSVREGDLESVKEHLINGANPNAKTIIDNHCLRSGSPIWELALVNKHFKVLKLLEEYGARVTHSFKMDEMMELFESPDREVIQEQLKEIKRTEYEVFQRAVATKHEAFARYLLENVKIITRSGLVLQNVLSGDFEAQFEEAKNLAMRYHRYDISIRNEFTLEIIYGYFEDIKYLKYFESNIYVTDKYKKLGYNIEGEKYEIFLELKRQNISKVIKVIKEDDESINWKIPSGITLFHAACIFGNLEVIELILEKGFDINAQIEYGETGLVIAIENNQVEIVHYLLDRGANPNIIYDGKSNALFHACRLGNIEIVKHLIKSGADVNEWGGVAEAGASGNYEIIKLLYTKGVTRSLCSIMGIKAAANNQHFEIVRYILENVSFIHKAKYVIQYAALTDNEEILKLAWDKTDHYEKGISAALFDSCKCNFLNSLRFLIGLDINFSKIGLDALEASIYYNHPEAAKLLLERGVDPNNTCALNLAAEKGYVHLMKLLIEHGGDPEGKGTFNQTVIEEAAEYDQTEAFEYLLQIGVKNWYLGVSLACKYGHTELVRLIFKYFSTKEISEKCFHAKACRGCHIDIIRLLYEKGITFNDPEYAFECACKGGDIVITNFLLDNEIMKDKDYALFIATETNHLEITRNILGRGADPTVKYPSGSCSIEVAGREGSVQIINELQKYTSDTKLIAEGYSLLLSTLSSFIIPTTNSKNRLIEIRDSIVDLTKQGKSFKGGIVDKRNIGDIDEVLMLVENGAKCLIDNNEGISRWRLSAIGVDNGGYFENEYWSRSILKSPK